MLLVKSDVSYGDKQIEALVKSGLLDKASAPAPASKKEVKQALSDRSQDHVVAFCWLLYAKCASYDELFTSGVFRCTLQNSFPLQEKNHVRTFQKKL